jgi:type IV fimbrial biogenesis protein FimT
MKEVFLKRSLLKVRKNFIYEQGFTLIELMVTLVVLAVIVTLAAPSFVTFINNNRATGATNDLIVSFNLARTEAIKRNGTVLLQSKNGTDWSEGHLIRVSSTSEILRDVDAAHSTVTMDSASNAVSEISYTSSGAVTTASTTTFTIDTSNCETGVSRKKRLLQLNLSGSSTLTASTEVCP